MKNIYNLELYEYNFLISLIYNMLLLSKEIEDSHVP